MPDAGRPGLPLSTLAFAAAVLLAAAFAGLFVAQDYAAWRAEEAEALAAAADTVAAATERRLERYEALLHAVTESEEVRRRDAAACGAYFARLRALLPGAVNVAAIGADGRFFASGLPFGPQGPPDARELPFFQALAAGAPRYVMDPHRGPVSGEQVAGFVLPLRDEGGGFAGLVGLSVRLADLEQVWEGVRPGRPVAVIDRQGVVIHGSAVGPLARGAKLGDLAGLRAGAATRAVLGAGAEAVAASSSAVSSIGTSTSRPSIENCFWPRNERRR